MTKIYESDPLLNSYTVETEHGPIDVEERDPDHSFEARRAHFQVSPARFLKEAFEPDNEDELPSFPKGESHQWIYKKKGVIISLLEVQGLGWKFEVYPFDPKIKLLNDPHDSGIERYDDLDEAKKAVIKLFEQVK